ncbi:crotonase/enoyl-CoA hydratase family protein [Halieaceae bacterium IMCC8485]|uniref:Crotonase/enoyl-CoA hydratase family protein n=1 Tax=Candidatus Seongchinamella marina TaxID=2518990 RepID=A0ABT3SQD5_9GAMM|nr:crotonase/enoyl-CoA hydratase family protein [Candidatus Seongchinamella marina]MCX2972174.1 crotonase/enoyl-CoA hydratase family protein [Candidatus Seongchinamella marina]
MSQIVQFAEEEKYSLITLDDGKANAVSFVMLDQLNSALDQAEEAGKVVVITGRPSKFSAGFDLSVMSQGGEQVMKLVSGGADFAKRILQFPTPVVIAVTGHALAMGGIMLMTADYRIGIAGDYKLGLNEVAIGMSMPRFGVEIARSRLAPAHFELSVNCAYLYDAEGAVEAGYLDEAVESGQLMYRAVAIAEQLSGLNMEAHKNTKSRVRAPLLRALEEAMELDFAEGGGL